MKKLKIFISLMFISASIFSGGLNVNAATYTYDDLNRLTSVTYENGVEIDYTYDAGGNITRIVTSIEDKIPPEVQGTNPVENAIDVPVDQKIIFIFNENVQPGIEYRKIAIEDNHGSIIAVEQKIEGNKLIVRPLDSLLINKTYTVTVPARSVKDMAGNNQAEPYILHFTTRSASDITGPQVIWTSPENGASGVLVIEDITLTFSEDIREGDAFGSITLLDVSGNVIDTTPSISGNELIIMPYNKLDYRNKYTVTIPAGAVQDMAGNYMTSPFSISFTTQVVRNKISPGGKGAMVPTTAPSMFRSSRLSP